MSRLELLTFLAARQSIPTRLASSEIEVYDSSDILFCDDPTVQTPSVKSNRRVVQEKMLSRVLRCKRRTYTAPTVCGKPLLARRTLIAAPTRSDGPLMSRRPDRALPEIPSSSKLWFRTLPIFIAILTASSLAIFNYQKATSSIVNSTLYALRTSEEGRRLLGDEVYFRDKFPWIWGEMNQLHGRVDISFGVKGTKGKGMMRFKSIRKTRMGFFETQEWSLEMEDGTKVYLLDEKRPDPFKNTALEAET